MCDFFKDTIIRLPGCPSLTLKNTIFRQHALIGRGTCVLWAIPSEPVGCVFDVEPSQTVKWSNHSVVVVKLGWVTQSRKSEASIIDLAIKSASIQKHEWVKNHLPEVLYSHQYPLQDGPHDRLIRHLDAKGPKFDKRELRLIVQTELFPITQLTNAKEVKKVFREILECTLISIDPFFSTDKGFRPQMAV